MAGMTLLEVIGFLVLEALLLHLTVLAVLRAWFMGSIFEHWRSYVQVYGGRLGELLSCPLCLSYHVAFWFEVIFLVPAKAYVGSWLLIVLAPLAVFAAAGAAQSSWFKYHRDWQ